MKQKSLKDKSKIRGETPSLKDEHRIWAEKFLVCAYLYIELRPQILCHVYFAFPFVKTGKKIMYVIIGKFVL